MKCGYCINAAIVLMTYKLSRGGTRSVPMCANCAQRADKPDNFGDRPTFEAI